MCRTFFSSWESLGLESPLLIYYNSRYLRGDGFEFSEAITGDSHDPAVEVGFRFLSDHLPVAVSAGIDVWQDCAEIHIGLVIVFWFQVVDGVLHVVDCCSINFSAFLKAFPCYSRGSWILSLLIDGVEEFFSFVACNFHCRLDELSHLCLGIDRLLRGRPYCCRRRVGLSKQGNEGGNR